MRAHGYDLEPVDMARLRAAAGDRILIARDLVARSVLTEAVRVHVLFVPPSCALIV